MPRFAPSRSDEDAIALESFNRQQTVYAWDLRNRIVSATISSQTTAYAYDHTVGWDLSQHLRLNDAQLVGSATSDAPCDYSKPDYRSSRTQEFARKTGATPQTATLARSYILGLSPQGQWDSQGMVYFLRDGHGSNRALISDQGTVEEAYDYEAFGDPIGFDPASADTIHLFGGDAEFDVSSRLYYHDARWRDGFVFTSMDSFAGYSQDPLSLHKHLYAGANPIIGADPSGYLEIFDDPGMNSMVDAGISLLASVGGLVATQALAPLFGGIAVFEGIQLGITNATMAPSGVDPAAAFGIGFAAGVAPTLLRFAGVACWAANGIGGAILTVGNDYLAHPNDFSWERALADALAGGVMAALTGSTCFVAGTVVLRGDGQTVLPIDQIHVGQRVATDGGVANSTDSETTPVNPNATEVDPATWRLVTVRSDDWEVQTLVPLSWIETTSITQGQLVPLTQFVDLAEMGVPDGLFGFVESISACPDIESGYGRVVLTTVSHLSNFVYDLTLSDSEGRTDTLGVTGYHRFYTEDRGWIIASELYLGETVRTGHGDVTVTSLVREAGTYRVYNITVEADHVYFVGDLTALAHNQCGSYGLEFSNGMNYAGKGPISRMMRSISSIEKRYGIKLTNKNWTPAANDTDAFIQEAIRLRGYGGPGGNTYNRINSPGEKILQMLGL